MTWRKTGKSLAFNDASLNADMTKAIKEFEKIALAEHEKVTETWEHKPKFRARRSDWTGSERLVAVHVWTDDDIWRYVDEGTKPHVIRPKNPDGLLVFPSSFKPKTQPRSLSSGAGASGGPMVFAKEVHHPGTKPRNFTAMLQRKLENIFSVMINAVFKAHGPRIMGG